MGNPCVPLCIVMALSELRVRISKFSLFFNNRLFLHRTQKYLYMSKGKPRAKWDGAEGSEFQGQPKPRETTPQTPLDSTAVQSSGNKAGIRREQMKWTPAP